MIQSPAFGPLITPDDVTFRLWAPTARHVELVHERQAHEMTCSNGGWFKFTVSGALPGLRYRFRIDDDPLTFLADDWRISVRLPASVEALANASSQTSAHFVSIVFPK